LAATLSACNSGGAGSPSNVMPQGGVPQFAPAARELSDAIAPNALSPVKIYPGEVVGTDDMFKPGDGDAKDGGRGQKVGKIPCLPTEYLTDYHVHAYLGLVVNGKQVAIPDSIGLKKPGPESNGYISTAVCFYYIHTHDASGMIHIEDPKALAPSATVYTLADFLHIWGVGVSKYGVGKFHGHVHVFIGNVPALGQTTVKKYAAFTDVANVDTIPLKSHEAIWIEVGKSYFTAKQLPSVNFYTEY
jgi:hypothetical protein